MAQKFNCFQFSKRQTAKLKKVEDCANSVCVTPGITSWEKQHAAPADHWKAGCGRKIMPFNESMSSMFRQHTEPFD